MDVRTRWPWISMLLAILVVISPLGRDVIHGAFYSGEALARHISMALLQIGLGILALIIGVEWLIRLIILRRRTRGATTSD